MGRYVQGWILNISVEWIVLSVLCCTPWDAAIMVNTIILAMDVKLVQMLIAPA